MSSHRIIVLAESVIFIIVFIVLVGAAVGAVSCLGLVFLYVIGFLCIDGGGKEFPFLIDVPVLAQHQLFRIVEHFLGLERIGKVTGVPAQIAVGVDIGTRIICAWCYEAECGCGISDDSGIDHGITLVEQFHYDIGGIGH